MVTFTERKTVIKTDPFPQTVYELRKNVHWEFTINLKWFKYSRGFEFTFFNFLILVEDRKPTIEDAEKKYKTKINLTIFNKTIFSVIAKTRYFPFIMVNNKEI